MISRHLVIKGIFSPSPVQELCQRKECVMRFHQFCNSRYCSWRWSFLQASSPGSGYRSRSHIFLIYILNEVSSYCIVKSISCYVSSFVLQEVADTESGEKSVLYLLLKMFVTSGSSHLKTSTRMLVLKVGSHLLYDFALWEIWFCK